MQEERYLQSKANWPEKNNQSIHNFVKEEKKMGKLRMEPRKITDRGGWLCMPLVKNVPEGKEGWEKVHCSVCGELCWKRPEDAGVIYHSKLDGACCTLCALKKEWNENIKS